MTVRTAVNSVILQCTDAVRQLLVWTDIPTFRGNAKDWASAGAAAGYNVSHLPAAGDAAVWQAGQLGADRTYGHVAAVTGVNPATGDVTIEQANWPEGSGIHSAVLPAAYARQLSYVAPKTAMPNAGPPEGSPNAAPVFDWTPWNVPGEIAGAAGSAIGTGAGTLAGDIAGGVITGTTSALGSFGEATVFPWFRHNAVALVAATIIFAIATHGTKMSPMNLNITMPKTGGSGKAPAVEEAAEAA